jgi:hypothetical protein
MSIDSEFVKYSEEITAEVMTDLSVLPANTSVQRMWLILSALQYTWRDPQLSKPTRDTLRDIGNGCAAAILSRHPDARRLIDAGWDVDYDVDQDGNAGGNIDNDESYGIWWMPFGEN